MITNTLLITLQDLQDYQSVGQYVEAKYLYPLILDLQVKYVKDLLCKDFYIELLEQVENNTLTPANELLLYGNGVTFFGVRAYLSWLAYKKWVFSGQQKSTQTGIRTHVSQWSEPASDKVLTNLIQDAEYSCEYYRKDLLTFLEANKADYPLWTCGDCAPENKIFHLGAVKKNQLVNRIQSSRRS